MPVISDSGTIHYQAVTTDNNNGVKVSILDGIKTGDVVGLNVSEELPEGQKVRMQQ